MLGKAPTGEKLEMNRFEVDLSPQARKYYKKAPRHIASALDDCFRQLENNPFYLAGKIRRLSGREGLFRYIVGDLRVVYRVNTQKRKVEVGAILPRGDVYKRI